MTRAFRQKGRDLSTRKLRALPPAGDPPPSAVLFQSMAEHAPGLLWTFRPDGSFEQFNRRVTEFTGATEAELRDLRWHAFVHAQDLPYVLQRWRDSAAFGEPFEVQFRLRRADGAYRWHLIAARPVRDAAGRILRWVGSGTDIEDQLQAARVLASRSDGGDAAERLRSIMTLTSDFYWETDAKHRFTVLEAGGRFEPVMFVASRIGKTRWEVPSVLPDADGWRAHRETLRTRLPFRDFETARVGDDGVLRHYSIDGEPVFDAAGRFSGYRGVGRDITARKQAERAAAESAAWVQSLLDNLPAIAWIKDAQFRYVWVSASYALARGLRSDQVLGRDDFELWPVERARRYRREDEMALRVRGAVSSMDVQVPAAGGMPVRGRVVRFPLLDAAGTTRIAGIAFELAPRSGIAAEVRQRDAALARLSARERQVLTLVVDGHTSAEIAARLSLSPKSVDTYRSRLMAKLGLGDLPSLVKFAIRHGLVSA